MGRQCPRSVNPAYVERAKAALAPHCVAFATVLSTAQGHRERRSEETTERTAEAMAMRAQCLVGRHMEERPHTCKAATQLRRAAPLVCARCGTQPLLVFVLQPLRPPMIPVVSRLGAIPLNRHHGHVGSGG